MGGERDSGESTKPENAILEAWQVEGEHFDHQARVRVLLQVA